MRFGPRKGARYADKHIRASKQQEFDLAGPLLRFARRPDEKQALDDRRHRSSLACKKQTVHHPEITDMPDIALPGWKLQLSPAS